MFTPRSIGTVITAQPIRDSRQLSVADRAEVQLRRKGYPALHAISCRCANGVVTLHGHVPTYYLKQMAQATVAAVEGVEEIVNDIKVMEPAQRTIQKAISTPGGRTAGSA